MHSKSLFWWFIKSFRLSQQWDSWGWNQPDRRCGFRCRQQRRCGIIRSTSRKRRHPPTALQPPKSCRHTGRALLQECCQLRYYYSTQGRLRGGEKKRLQERKRGERWIEREPNIYSRHTKARPVHMLVMELPWHIVKWGIMMTKHCPRIKECERTVKRSRQTELHAFLCSDLTEMQRQAGCPLCLKFEFIYLRWFEFIYLRWNPRVGSYKSSPIFMDILWIP